MGAMNFEVTTDLSTVAQTKIDTNFEAVKAWLEEELAPYATMVVTPDAISDAKKTRAAIRKVADSIDSQRKAIKKLWNAPYMEYEEKCKELTGIVNAAVGNIDGQIKAMENELKEEKRQELEQFFVISSADVADYISFSDVFDLRWLNSTFKMEEAMNAISARVFATKQDLETIRGMESPYEAVMLAEYSKSHDLRSSIQEAKRLESIQKAEEERKAKEVAEDFDEPEMPTNEIVEPPEYTLPNPAQFIRPSDEPPLPKLHTLRFEVTGTAEAFGALKRCMVANKMTYIKL